MAFVSYDVADPNALITKMAEYISAQGYKVVEPLMDDLNIYNMQTTDGKKFVFKDATDTYFINLRSANGYKIFGNNVTLDTESLPGTPDASLGGVGCTISEGYSKTVRWFAQYHAPVKYSDKNFYLGTGISMPIGKGGTVSVAGGGTGVPDEDYSGNYKLYCNRVTQPTDTLVFSLVKHVPGHWAYLCSTLVIGNLYKYDTWDGGIFMSSNADYTLKSMSEFFNNKHIYTKDNPDGDDIITDAGIGVIFGNGNTLPHTFLRINIDSAPSKEIYWACDVDNNNNGTGKHLALPLKLGGLTPAIPHYGNMQSKTNLDSGANCNTLNSITVNMPIYMAVKVDPDILGNYAAVGYVNGVYFISSYNIQATGCYEIDYPENGMQCQVFPLTCRRGKFGFDAISVKQGTT